MILKGETVMRFLFNTQITEQDYLDFNIFVATVSPYGKKQIIELRIFTLIAFGIASLVAVIGGSFFVLVPYAIVCAALQLAIKPGYGWLLKRQMRSAISSGKPGYSPSAEIEFFEESFVEKTEYNKTEQKYSSVERVSIIEGRIIYIHVNNVMAYMLPISSFESGEQYKDFLDFIKTKCERVDTYAHIK